MINFFPSLSIHEDTERKKAKTNLMQALNLVIYLRSSYKRYDGIQHFTNNNASKLELIDEVGLQVF